MNSDANKHKSKVNADLANTSANATNMYQDAVALLPASQAACYKHAWATLFNKLSKDEQDGMLENCAMAVEIKECPPVAQAFVRSVAELGESFFRMKQKEQGNSKLAKD